VSAATGQRERHALRLLLFVALSLFFVLFAKSSIQSSFSVLVTSITILTGFTFTALFSDHTMADIGLPPPKNENDKADQVRLGVLGENFKFRSSYFIALSIIGAVLMTVVSLELSSPKNLSAFLSRFWIWVAGFFTSDPEAIKSIFLNSTSNFLTTIVVFIYLECLYTFYRLSETILSIVNLRRSYIRHSENNS